MEQIREEMSVLMYLQTVFIPGLAHQQTVFSMQDVYKGQSLGSTNEERKRMKQEWAAREVKVRCKPNNTLAQLPGNSGPRMALQSCPELGPMAWSLISHIVLSLNMRPKVAEAIPDGLTSEG